MKKLFKIKNKIDVIARLIPLFKEQRISRGNLPLCLSGKFVI